MAADDSRGGHGDFRPVPDPTVLTTAQLLRELGALRELLETRLDAMDLATSLLSETVNRTPTVIQTEIAHLRELDAEKFAGITLQFAERDVRTEQAAKAGKEALDAALLSAKELVAQQNEANRGEAAKTEQNFTKQIDAQAARIDELKERIDRGEGSTQGSAVSRTERRLDIGQVIAVISVIVAVLAVVLYTTLKK